MTGDLTDELQAFLRRRELGEVAADVYPELSPSAVSEALVSLAKQQKETTREVTALRREINRLLLVFSPSQAMTEFTCVSCDGTFPKGWSDDEARAEAVGNGLDPDDPDLETVCDDCYQKGPTDK